MERRRAIAAASAVSISLLSGVVAISAHLGALGFAGTPVASTGRPAATAAAPATAVDQSISIAAQHEHDDGRATDDRHGTNDHEHEPSQAATPNQNTTIGTHDD
jgi:hypothetical protein